MTERRAANNTTYKKLAIQWLNEVLFFVSSFVVADSFVLRNRQLLVAANSFRQAKKKTQRTLHTFANRSKQPTSKLVKECNFPCPLRFTTRFLYL
jgi:hypothetical protein